MWALDTNTLIYFFKGQGRVAEALLTHAPQEIAIPAVVLYELRVGIARSSQPQQRAEQLARLSAVTRLLPFGDREAQAAAELRTELERAGAPIGPYDTLIAGTVLAHGAILVTRNTREFGRVKRLRLENWN